MCGEALPHMGWNWWQIHFDFSNQFFLQSFPSQLWQLQFSSCSAPNLRVIPDSSLSLSLTPNLVFQQILLTLLYQNLTICHNLYWHHPGSSHHDLWIIAVAFGLVPWFCPYPLLVYFQCRGQTDPVEHGSDYVTSPFRILQCLHVSFRKSHNRDLHTPWHLLLFFPLILLLLLPSFSLHPTTSLLASTCSPGPLNFLSPLCGMLSFQKFAWLIGLTSIPS